MVVDIYKPHLQRVIVRLVTVLLIMGVSASRAETLPERIVPFVFTENGYAIEGLDFSQVPRSSFHQRFIVITNASEHDLKNVVLKITGNFTASNCMSVFLPGVSCNVIINYKAPSHSGWDRKWLNIEFTVQQPDGSIYSNSQRLPVVGGVQLPRSDEAETVTP